MRATTFDTLAYAKKLQEAGFTPQQAEAQAEALRAVIDTNLATKQDIEEIKRDIEALRLANQHDIALVRRDIEVMRRDLIIWLGSIVVVATTVLGVLIKVI